MSKRTPSENDAFLSLVEPGDPSVYDVTARAEPREGSLPLTEERLAAAPSGTIFGLIQSTGMGWRYTSTDERDVLILSTQGGLARPDGSPIALGFHSGHWELSSLVAEAKPSCTSESAGCPGYTDQTGQQSPTSLIVSDSPSRSERHQQVQMSVR